MQKEKFELNFRKLPQRATKRLSGNVQCADSNSKLNPNSFTNGTNLMKNTNFAHGTFEVPAYPLGEWQVLRRDPKTSMILKISEFSAKFTWGVSYTYTPKNIWIEKRASVCAWRSH